MSRSNTPKVLVVIPARYASTRFPGKMIAPIAGKPLVVHTYERARRAALASEVLVAIDDARIGEAIRPHGVPFVMTRPDHPSGTDRIAEVAAGSDADLIVNVQGDEPLIDSSIIDATIRPLLDYPDVPMATARALITDPEVINNPNAVKVVCDSRGRALYFSRSPIPYIREKRDQNARCYWLHIGIYVYRREFLLQYAAWPVTPLERLEKLEQLRALEHGYPIAVVETHYEGVGVDSPEDLEQVRARIEAEEGRS